MGSPKLSAVPCFVDACILSGHVTMDGGRPNHEDWISGQASAPARGAPSMEESMRRSVAMRVERARIVEKANVEAGKREIGEARKAKRRA